MEWKLKGDERINFHRVAHGLQWTKIDDVQQSKILNSPLQQMYMQHASEGEKAQINGKKAAIPMSNIKIS